MPSDSPEPCETIELCPVCAGKMEIAYHTPKMKVCVCVECMTSLSIPNEAWDVAKRNRMKGI